jgi:hypothetical protein
MGIPLSSSFTMNAALPLDDRTQVADVAARNAIPAGKRYQGMIVYVIDEGTNYQLIGGILDANWQELSGSGGVTIVADYTALLAIDAGDRYDGLMVYQQDERVIWQFQGGTADADLVSITPRSLAITLDTTLTNLHKNCTLLVDCTSGNKTLTLPDASVTGNYHFNVIIKKIDSSANTVTIEGNASDQLDGQLNYVIYDQWSMWGGIVNGGNWYRTA